MADPTGTAPYMHEDRYSCLTARSAPVVLVVVRYQGEPRWTHLLRWDYENDDLAPGAWTTLHLKVHRCTLSGDGRFLRYLAEGPVGGPFNAQYGGAWAISRAPWLAALTHAEQWVGGGGESRDALGKRDQARLWDRVAPPNGDEPEWIDMLGPGWSRVESGEFEAQQPIGRTGWRVHVHHTPHQWHQPSPFDGRLAYTITSEHTDGTLDTLDASFDAGDLRWAQPLPGGRLATIDRAGRLEMRRFPAEGGPPEVIARHELAGRTPEPAKSPDWARAPLAFGELWDA